MMLVLHFPRKYAGTLTVSEMMKVVEQMNKAWQLLAFTGGTRRELLKELDEYRISLALQE